MAKVMKLLDKNTGLMECKVCGVRHTANIKPDSNGKYYRGSWQWQNGCKLPKKIKSATAEDILGLFDRA
jgi:hypothetical protein